MLNVWRQNEGIIWPRGTTREEVPYIKFNHHIARQNFSTQNFTIPYFATCPQVALPSFCIYTTGTEGYINHYFTQYAHHQIFLQVEAAISTEAHVLLN